MNKNLGFEDVLPWPKLIHFPKESAGFVGPWVDHTIPPKLGRQRAFRWLSSCRKGPAQKKNCQHLRQSSRYRKSSEHGSMAQNAQNGHHLHPMRFVFSVLNRKPSNLRSDQLTGKPCTMVIGKAKPAGFSLSRRCTSKQVY